MFLKPSHSAPKLKMPGARPVSVALEKRYSGIDPESEMLRARERAKAAAAEAAKKQLFKEKLQLCGIITLLALPVMLFGSRILRALRLMNNPEDTHWTLK
ncbi:MAG: hypothetical protein KKH28_04130 [Elusimicrobia bacterium]|nr:hypothetical protein [Elusimicrobiota bacterium]